MLSDAHKILQTWNVFFMSSVFWWLLIWGMGTGASSNASQSNINTVLAAARWRSSAHSTRSSASGANVPQQNATDARSSDGNLDVIKVEGRYENLTYELLDLELQPADLVLKIV